HAAAPAARLEVAAVERQPVGGGEADHLGVVAGLAARHDEERLLLEDAAMRGREMRTTRWWIQTATPTAAAGPGSIRASPARISITTHPPTTACCRRLWCMVYCVSYQTQNTKH